ncbi:hypothetical protein ACFUJY_10540 [Streptomyces sp. NPDC057249]|uniref:hypothetical protein n=1 Tax=Streptomyces sp. NPDC057249 TaxID=3346067 RepID=UPI0036318993
MPRIRNATPAASPAGALTSALGTTALVYGFIRSAHGGWSDPYTDASFCAAFVLLATYIVVEHRSRKPIPRHMFADWKGAGTYEISLCLAAAIFGMSFCLRSSCSRCGGFSPLEAGLAFLPVSTVIEMVAGLTSQLLPMYGSKHVMVLGSLCLALAYLTNVRSTHAGSALDPTLVISSGMGTMVVSQTLMALSDVRPRRVRRGLRPPQHHRAGRQLAGPCIL